MSKKDKKSFKKSKKNKKLGPVPRSTGPRYTSLIFSESFFQEICVDVAQEQVLQKAHKSHTWVKVTITDKKYHFGKSESPSHKEYFKIVKYSTWIYVLSYIPSLPKSEVKTKA